MNELRIDNIKKVFEGIGPNDATLYTNQEIVDLLQEFLNTMKTGIYEKVHSEYMRDKDVMIHIAALAEEYGLKETEAYKRFESNMKDLGYTIGSLIKGIKGERIARKALKAISFDRNVKILYNIALADADAQSEYDAIVITPYGVFVIEVKNWDGELHIDANGLLQKGNSKTNYDLPGRMSIKEGLLREYLGEIFPERYQGIVLFPNENIEVKNDFEQLSIWRGGGVAYKIRSFNEGKDILTTDQINEIVEKIISNHKEQRTLCKVRCNEIVEDYALLMAAIEETSDGTYSLREKLINGEQEPKEEVQKIESANIAVPESCLQEKVTRRLSTRSKVDTVAGLVASFGLGLAVAKIITSRK